MRDRHRIISFGFLPVRFLFIFQFFFASKIFSPLAHVRDKGKCLWKRFWFIFFQQFDRWPEALSVFWFSNHALLSDVSQKKFISRMSPIKISYGVCIGHVYPIDCPTRTFYLVCSFPPKSYELMPIFFRGLFDLPRQFQKHYSSAHFITQYQTAFTVIIFVRLHSVWFFMADFENSNTPQL